MEICPEYIEDGEFCLRCGYHATDHEERRCHCDQLDEDLIEAGYTCYNCHAYRKDNPEKRVI
jgi:hypothetical protein